MRNKAPHLLTGLACRLVQLRLRGHILLLAMGAYRNPALAIKALKALLQKKKAVLGEAGNPKLVKAGTQHFWSITAAGWPSNAFDLFVKSELGKVSPLPKEKSSLHTIIMSITSRCPLNCEHCYEWDNLAAVETLSLSQLQLVLSKFQDYGVCNIQLSGGEPLSRFEDLLQLLHTANNSSEFWILTSGFGLNAEKAEALKQAGLKGAVISLDSWDEAEHNRFRGNNQAYHWALEAAQNCVNTGLIAAFSLCAAREFVSYKNLYKYMQLAKRMCVSFVRILEPRQVGHYQTQDIELDEAQIGILTEFYRKTQSDKAWRNFPLIEYTGYFQRLFGCFGAGDRYLYVDSQGDIHACPFCQNPVANAVTGDIVSAISKLQETGCHKFQTIMLESEIAQDLH